MGCVHDFHDCEALGHRPDGGPLPAGRPDLDTKHREHPPIVGVLGMVAYCAECYDNWPCDAAVFWDEKISAEHRAAELEAERTRVNLTWNDAFNWLYVGLTNRLADLAAAARENERLAKALQDTLRRWSEMSQSPPNPVVVMQLAKGEVARIVAVLAVEPRDTSHLEPIPGKPGGFTNKNYRRLGAEPREPEGEKP